MRKCRYCHEDKLIEQFDIANKIKGKEYRRWKCKTCYLQMKLDRRKRQRQWLNEYKMTLSCEKCGFSDWRCIEFHHENNDKEFNVSEMIGWGKDTIIREIEKCIPLCANCHRIVEFENRGIG